MPIFSGLPVTDVYDAAGRISQARLASEQQRLAEEKLEQDRVESLARQRLASEQLRAQSTANALSLFVNGRGSVINQPLLSQPAPRVIDRGNSVPQPAFRDRAGDAISPIQNQLLKNQIEHESRVSEAKQMGYDFDEDQQKELRILKAEEDKILKQNAMRGLSNRDAISALGIIHGRRSAIVPRTQTLSGEQMFERTTVPGPDGQRYPLGPDGRPDWSKPIGVKAGQKPYGLTEWEKFKTIAEERLEAAGVVDPSLAEIQAEAENVVAEYEVFAGKRKPPEVKARDVRAEAELTGDFRGPVPASMFSPAAARFLQGDLGIDNRQPEQQKIRAIQRATPGSPGPLIAPPGAQVSPEAAGSPIAPPVKSTEVKPIKAVTPKNIGVMSSEAAKSGDTDFSLALRIIEAAAKKHKGMPKIGTEDYDTVQQALKVLEARKADLKTGAKANPEKDRADDEAKRYLKGFYYPSDGSGF